MSEVTRILSAIEHGDPHAAEQLLPLIYDELRKLAADKMARERPGQTLQATALVHETYLRLVDVAKAQHWNSRGHFFAAAAEAMRRILVENARRKGSVKHGGARQRANLEEAAPYAPVPADELLALHEALDELAREDPKKAELVKLRYFSGLSVQSCLTGRPPSWRRTRSRRSSPSSRGCRRRSCRRSGTPTWAWAST
jgi:RNA polymerase sigma factor (TIGR02999 family)